MTEAELAEIEARANAATPGPWGFYYEGSSDWCFGPKEDPQGEDMFALVHVRGASVEERWRTIHPFIAHAREDIPALVAEVRRARAIRETFEEEARRMTAELRQAQEVIAALQRELRSKQP